MKQPDADLIDFRRSAPLWDVGAPEYAAVVAVDAHGIDRLWLSSRDHINRDDAEVGNGNQPHEQLGRLPRDIRDAIWGDQLRCGAITATGKPCRARVAKPGDRCGCHRAKASAVS